jgi:hypothetical protein
MVKTKSFGSYTWGQAWLGEAVLRLLLTQKRHTTKVLLSGFYISRGFHMTAATKVFPATLEKTETTTDFIPVALFSGVGLLLSLAVMILDQLSPAVEWF